MQRAGRAALNSSRVASRRCSSSGLAPLATRLFSQPLPDSRPIALMPANSTAQAEPLTGELVIWVQAPSAGGTRARRFATPACSPFAPVKDSTWSAG